MEIEQQKWKDARAQVSELLELLEEYVLFVTVLSLCTRIVVVFFFHFIHHQCTTDYITL